MSTENPGKMRIDMQELTLADMDDVADLLDGVPMDEMMKLRRGRAIAAIVTVMRRKIDPDFTIEQAYQLSPTRDLELIGLDDDHPEAPGDGNGTGPLSSLASGS